MQRERYVGRGSNPGDGEREIKPLPPDQQEKALADIAATLQATMPPRENPRINTSIDSVYASGPLGRAPLRDPRELQLQADRNAAGLRRILAAADCSEEGWLCLRLSGVRASELLGQLRKLRTGDEPNSDGSQLMQPGGAYDRAIHLLSGR